MISGLTFCRCGYSLKFQECIVPERGTPVVASGMNTNQSMAHLAIMNRRLNRLWLCAPFLIVALIDAGITLYGQSEAYWQGQYSDPNELFSIFAIALYFGPLAFIGVYSV